jgi:nicotinamide mononucleotide adenylyltransferase
MDTNQENGVSLQDIADLMPDEEQVTDESGEDEREEEIANSDDSETQEDPPEEGGDSEEVDFEGKTYKVPKELKEALLRQSDYTKKTQEVAEQRKAVEQRAQALQQQEQLLSQSFEKRVELAALQKQLSQYDQIDWQELADNDPARATKLNIAYQQLQRQAQLKVQELQQAHTQNEQLTAQQRQQMLVQAQGDLKARIPTFNAETAEKIKTAARDYGISDSELNQVIDPRYVHVLHDAMQWRALQAAKPKAMQKVAEAPKVMKPQAVQPKPRTNQAASERLAKHGRMEDLAAFL